jgi:hypothetical protein
MDGSREQFFWKPERLSGGDDGVVVSRLQTDSAALKASRLPNAAENASEGSTAGTFPGTGSWLVSLACVLGHRAKVVTHNRQGHRSAEGMVVPGGGIDEKSPVACA